MNFRAHGSPIVWAWAGINAALAGVLVGFGGPTSNFRIPLFWGAVGILILAGAALLLRPAHLPKRRQSSGAVSLALAGACFFGGLAWVFGVYLAYFALPLLAFCVGRWRQDYRARGEQ